MAKGKQFGKYNIMTKLPSRFDYLRRIDEVLEEKKGTDFAILSLDIANFHFFNKWFGREKGDELLANIGDYLVKLDSETGSISGYMGGDNFSIFFEFDTVMANRITENISRIISSYNSETSNFHAIYGAYHTEGLDIIADEMYDYSIDALHSADDMPNAKVCWFDNAKVRKQEEMVRIIPEVLDGLHRKDFTFYLQPKCHLRTGTIIGSEALVRWIHPEKGMIPPSEFIPVLESHGLITRLDAYVWEAVCEQLRKWIDMGYHPLPISVNVSRVDIYNMDVVDFFGRLLRKYDLPASMIEIEVTESAYVESDRKIWEAIIDFRQAGYKVLIDDFGSGYSSLNMLKDVQVDVLKIDMKFLDINRNNSQKGARILESVLEIARDLHIPAITEGVETKNQLETLISLGCEFGQGYLFYKPMPIEDYQKLMDTPDLMGKKQRQVHVRRRSYLSELSKYFIKVADVNIATGEFHFIRQDDEYYYLCNPEPSSIWEYVNRFVSNEIIFPDDVDGYRDFMKADTLLTAIQKGKRRFRHIIRYKMEGAYHWVTFEITVPDDFSPDDPWLLFSWKRAASNTPYTQDLLQLVKDSFFKVIRIDLLNGRYRKVDDDSDRFDANEIQDDVESWLRQYAEEGNIHPEDIAKYIAFTDINAIRTYFRDNSTPAVISYRCLREDGSYGSILMTLSRSVEYGPEREVVLMTLKRSEEALVHRVNRGQVEELLL